MKKIFILAACMFAAGTASAAGPLEYGVKAGVNSSNFDLVKNNLEQTYLSFNKARTGYFAGAWMRLNLGTMFVQPEIQYNWNAYDAGVWDSSFGDGQNSKIKVQTIDVPALVGFKLLVLRLNAGPVFTVMNKTKTKGGRVQSADVLKPTVSYTAGFGLDIAKVALDVRYNGMFARTKQSLQIGDRSFPSKINSRGWSVSLGYAF